jgi:hypothetical protein
MNLRGGASEAQASARPRHRARGRAGVRSASVTCFREAQATPARPVARDHYIRLDTNDYSVHPAVIGRRIEVIAGLDRVRAFCGGDLVADHERIWARHQTMTDPAHLAAVLIPVASLAYRRSAIRAS